MYRLIVFDKGTKPKNELLLTDETGEGYLTVLIGQAQGKNGDERKSSFFDNAWMLAAMKLKRLMDSGRGIIRTVEWAKEPPNGAIRDVGALSRREDVKRFEIGGVTADGLSVTRVFLFEHVPDAPDDTSKTK